MKIKTSELQRADLNWAVAVCEGFIPDGFEPSENWADGGPIIEREKIGFWWATHIVDEDGVEHGNHWYAEMGMTGLLHVVDGELVSKENAVDRPYIGVDGPTALIAAMRCYVASKLGEEIDVPTLDSYTTL